MHMRLRHPRSIVRASAVLAALVAVPAVLPAAPAAAMPPAPRTVSAAGFTDTLVGTMSAPISITGLPDGRAVVLEKAGRVRVVKNGAVLPTPALSMTGEVCSSSERGMLGFAVDPAFAANGIVYVYYTRYSAIAPGGCVNRVSRFTMSGDTISRASEVVLLDNIGSPAGNHNGGDVEVGNDGFLYVAVGDGGCDPRNDSGCAGSNNAAQDLSLLNGKILRVNRLNGTPAPGNPISGPGTASCRVRGNTPSTPGTWCQELYAWGLRNPWRFAFDPNTGATRFYINDVGQGSREEVDLGQMSANYGWPEREGQCAQGAQTPCAGPDPAKGYTQPITDYSHVNGRGDFGGEYVTGGAFIPNGAWPSEYDGGYLFADGNPGSIFFRPAVVPPNPNAVYANPFVTGVGGISDLGFVMESTGWVVYTANPATGEVRRIAPVLSSLSDPGSLAYTPVTPQRVFDSRNAGAISGQVRAGTSRLVQVVASQGNHRAALVNLTYVRPQTNGFLAAWPARTPRPPSSNINGQTGQVAANASIVPIDADGRILVFSSATAHVIVDVVGFFDVASVSAAGRLTPLGPARAADTRQPISDTNLYSRAAAGGDTTVNVPLAGRLDVTSAVSAVVLTVTALSDVGADEGFVTVYPGGGSLPSISNVNTSANGDRRANLVVVPLGADGSVDLRLHVVTDVIVDVVGAFTGSSATVDSAGLYRMIAPSREVDTRTSTPFGRITGGSTRTVNPAAVPDGVLAVSQNMVVVLNDSPGFVTAYPSSPTRPNVSNLNANLPGQTRSALAITTLGTGSAIDYYSSMTTDLVVDVTGYFQLPAG